MYDVTDIQILQNHAHTPCLCSRPNPWRRPRPAAEDAARLRVRRLEARPRREGAAGFARGPAQQGLQSTLQPSLQPPLQPPLQSTLQRESFARQRLGGTSLALWLLLLCLAIFTLMVYGLYVVYCYLFCLLFSLYTSTFRCLPVQETSNMSFTWSGRHEPAADLRVRFPVSSCVSGIGECYLMPI